jgi:hypothetical protein
MPSYSNAGSMTNFPQGFAYGVTVRGVPIVQTNPGLVFWLNNDNVLMPGQRVGSDRNRGTFLDPFATLNYALNTACVPGRGDVIICDSGHNERISSATALSLATSDVAVIGIGSGTSRPIFTLDTAAASTITLTGNNISFSNCQFVANYANITSLFTQAAASVTGGILGTTFTVTAVGSGTLYPGNTLACTATGFQSYTVILSQTSGTTGGVGVYVVDNSQTVAAGSTFTTIQNFFALDNCEVRDTNATHNFLSVLTTNTVSNGFDGFSLTRSNILLAATSGAVNLCPLAGIEDRWTIADNYFTSLTTGAGAVMPFAAGKYLTNALILRNRWNVQNATGTATGWFITTNNSNNTGFIDGNMSHGLPTNPLMVTASSGFVYGLNYWADQPDTQGYLVPVADS